MEQLNREAMVSLYLEVVKTHLNKAVSSLV